MEPLRTSLSIIMPVFNHRDEVRTMIDSILANDFNAWELLAVDDGSGEDTLQLLESYAAADSRRVLRPAAISAWRWRAESSSSSSIPTTI